MRKRNHLISCSAGVADAAFDAADKEGRRKREKIAAGDGDCRKWAMRPPRPWSEEKETENAKKRYRESPVLTAEMAFLLGTGGRKNE